MMTGGLVNLTAGRASSLLTTCSSTTELSLFCVRFVLFSFESPHAILSGPIQAAGSASFLSLQLAFWLFHVLVGLLSVLYVSTHKLPLKIHCYENEIRCL